MYTKKAELTAGLVVLGGLAAFLWLLYVATGKGFFETYSLWHVRFAQGDSAPEVGDPVVYLGLTIGRVSRVEQAFEVRRGEQLTAADRAHLAALPAGSPPEVREVFVLAELELPREQRLPEGTVARLQKNLVTGTPTLMLVPGFSTRDLLPESTHAAPLPGSQGATIEDITGKIDLLIASATDATKDVSAVLAEAKGFLEELRGKLRALDTQTLNDNVVAASASLRTALATAEREIETIGGNLRAATTDLGRLAASGAAAVEQARADLAALMTSLKSAGARIDKVVEDAAPKVDRVLDEASALAQQLTRLARDLEGVGPEARAAVANVGGDLDRILAILEDASRNILDATEDIRAHPWKLANKPDDGVVAFENLRVASLTYVRAMSGMEQAATALRDLLARPDAAAPEVRAQVSAALAAFQRSREGYEAAAKRFAELLGAYTPRGPR